MANNNSVWTIWFIYLTPGICSAVTLEVQYWNYSYDSFIYVFWLNTLTFQFYCNGSLSMITRKNVKHYHVSDNTTDISKLINTTCHLYSTSSCFFFVSSCTKHPLQKRFKVLVFMRIFGIHYDITSGFTYRNFPWVALEILVIGFNFQSRHSVMLYCLATQYGHTIFCDNM